MRPRCARRSRRPFLQGSPPSVPPPPPVFVADSTPTLSVSIPLLMASRTLLLSFKSYLPPLTFPRTFLHALSSPPPFFPSSLSHVPDFPAVDSEFSYFHHFNFHLTFSFSRPSRSSFVLAPRPPLSPTGHQSLHLPPLPPPHLFFFLLLLSLLPFLLLSAVEADSPAPASD